MTLVGAALRHHRAGLALPPPIVLRTKSRPALTTGLLTIGPGGLATAAAVFQGAGNCQTRSSGDRAWLKLAPRWAGPSCAWPQEWAKLAIL